VSPAGPAPEIKTFSCVLKRAAEEFDCSQLKSIVSVPVREFNAQGGVASHSMAKGWSFGWVSGVVPPLREKFSLI
jgi:hypothetical protein